MSVENEQNEEKLNKIINAIGNISDRMAAMEKRLDRVDKNNESRNLVFSSLPQPSAHMIEAIRAKIEKGTGGPNRENEKANKAFASGSASLQNKSFESELGLKWFGRIGIIALIFGISFFLKYAFENDWIGETGRVVMGIIAGLFFIIIGDFLRKKYAQYSQMLTGGGIAILYLSIYASFAYYQLVAQVPAFAAMGIITFSGAFLAINYESVTLAALAIIGGFLTPALVSTGVNNQPALFLYMSLLNLGILAISFFRNWRALNFIGLACTTILFLGWFGRYYSDKQLFLTEIFLIAWFIVYAIATLEHNIIFKKQANKTDALLILLNALWFFTVSYFLLVRDYGDFMGFFAIIMAAVYFGFAYMSYYLNPQDKYLSIFLPILSIFFITVAAPIQFDGNLVTIVWALETLGLVWAGINLNNYWIRRFALAIFALMFFRLIFIDNHIADLSDYTIILNWRFAAFVVGAISAFLIYYLYSKSNALLRPEELKGKTVMLFAANLLFLWILSGEVSAYFDKQIYRGADMFPPSCHLRIYERNTGYVNNSYCEQKYQEYNDNMRSIALRKTGVNSSKNTVLSVLWTVYAITLLVLGIARKNRLMRLMGFGLFIVVIFKLFFYDLWNLGLSYRIISFVILGLTLLLASFAYYKHKERIKEIL